MVEPSLGGQIVAANLRARLFPGTGWSLTVEIWRELDGQAPGETAKYDRLSRGELLDVVDAVRAELDLPLSEFR